MLGCWKDYNYLLSRAKKVELVCEGEYAAWKLHKRDEWMVDNGDLLVACWDGSSGGTGNTVNYANKVGREIKNIWNKSLLSTDNLDAPEKTHEVG